MRVSPLSAISYEPLRGWSAVSSSGIAQGRPMPNYRRALIPGGTYFFTVALADRRLTLLLSHIDLLRAAYAETARGHPFKTRAIVLLPEHLHAIWTLPPGDCDFSGRWKLIKERFSRAVRRVEPALGQVWQPRFWEHAIRDERDFETHADYVHRNPVKHGFVRDAIDWPYSSIRRYIAHARIACRKRDDSEP
ncbi:REP-associated tyrosine transposase [Dokdonella fugitiva]|uniref:REP-associated tyrosine transposase n=1 Tax=Dokdonella fugitiva TaxID=328517 RepID=UPI00181FEC56|nr:transposase [Dokdonella fugitiva]MBA8884214.1 putative transposase [Dokdonella fugitiva]